MSMKLVALWVALAPVSATAETPAEQWFRQGKSAYEEGRYDEAIRLFQEAFAAEPLPAFLLNIGQAYRAAGRQRDALDHYRLFLRADPESPLRAEVEQLIDTMERDLAAQTPPPGTSAQHPPPSSGAPTGTFPQPRERPWYARSWLWAIGAGVIGAVVVALVVTRDDSDASDNQVCGSLGTLGNESCP